MKKIRRIVILLTIFICITSLIKNVFAIDIGNNTIENVTQQTEQEEKQEVIETVAEPVAEEKQEQNMDEKPKETFTETMNTDNTKTTKSNNNDYSENETSKEEELSEEDLILKDVKLKELTILGYNIEFEPNKYNYSIEIEQNQRNLDITALANNDKATVTIENNENLDTGENKVIIKVTAEDGINQKEYIIYAIKDFEDIKLNDIDDNTKLIVIITCGASFIICFIIFIYKVKTRK